MAPSPICCLSLENRHQRLRDACAPAKRSTITLPFHHTHPGFSPDSLHLLDVALTKAWLERVANGAVLSAADPALCAELQAMVIRMERLQSGQRTPGIEPMHQHNRRTEW